VSAADPLILSADDRHISLRLEGHSAQDAGIGVPVHAPPGHTVTPNVYHTDLGTLRFLSEARNLAVLAPAAAGELPATYEIWDDQRPALRGLVQSLSGGIR
jgi:hypothetical protein